MWCFLYCSPGRKGVISKATGRSPRRSISRKYGTAGKRRKIQTSDVELLSGLGCFYRLTVGLALELRGLQAIELTAMMRTS